MTATNEPAESTSWEAEANLNKAEAEFYYQSYKDATTEVFKLSDQVKKERVFYFISIVSLLIIQIIVCLE